MSGPAAADDVDIAAMLLLLLLLSIVCVSRESFETFCAYCFSHLSWNEFANNFICLSHALLGNCKQYLASSASPFSDELFMGIWLTITIRGENNKNLIFKYFRVCGFHISLPLTMMMAVAAHMPKDL